METTMDTTKDKRAKRQIANSNERRRMQSINAGFQKLKRLLPVNDGEKLSKAAILQHAAEFIQQIDREKLILHEQNTRLRGTLLGVKAGTTPPETIDLDSLPTIPMITRLDSINCSQVNNNNTNSGGQQHNSSLNNSSSSTENSNDYCSSSTTTNRDPNSSAGLSLSCKQLTGKDVNNKTTSNHLNPHHPHSRHTAASNTRDPSIKNATHDSTRTSAGYQEHYPGVIGQTTNAGDIVSDRVTSPSVLVSTGGAVAKAAIALPLEVPYTLETTIRHHDLHQQPPLKMVKTETLAIIDPQEPPPKGQNLDTICKAIMEIEGDRVFTNENIKQPDLD